MGCRVILRSGEKERRVPAAPVFQSFLYPETLFSQDPAEDCAFWVCVRTRPRWEKKFAGWLMERRWNFFLPVFQHETFSGRKRRMSELPLFPGFVFVEGDRTKNDFSHTGAVVYVLRPRGPQEAAQLSRQLRNVWCGLTSGLYVAPVRALAAGEACRIIRGPLRGAEAKFERMGRGGCLVLQVEMMGGGIAVEVHSDEVEVSS